MFERNSLHLRHMYIYADDKAKTNDSRFADHCDSLRVRGEHYYVVVSGIARKLCGVILVATKEQRPTRGACLSNHEKEPMKSRGSHLGH